MSEARNDIIVPVGITAAVLEEFSKILVCPPDQIDLGRRITELPGMDSLNLVRAVVAIEERWQIDLAEDDLFDVRTGHDFCLLVARSVHQQDTLG
ncbi:MAG: acyl carrier protein [Mycobacterium sp.]|jgi:acyl carrier protein|nr:acyl carrier protein [Mycobacterium sp.]